MSFAKVPFYTYYFFPIIVLYLFMKEWCNYQKINYLTGTGLNLVILFTIRTFHELRMWPEKKNVMAERDGTEFFDIIHNQNFLQTKNLICYTLILEMHPFF